MPTFSFKGAHLPNTLSDLFMNMCHHLGLMKVLHTEVLLGEDGEHLCFNCLHLLIQLLEMQHLTCYD